jgi:hypothetical protein
MAKLEKIPSLEQLKKINESNTINKDVLATANMINFTSDYDNPTEYDYKIDGNEFEAINKGIAADISKELTANNIEHELNDVYVTLTGIVSEALDKDSVEMAMVDFNAAVKDMFGIDNKTIHMNDVPEILSKYDIVLDGKPIQNDDAGIAKMKEILAQDKSYTIEEGARTSAYEAYSVNVGKGEIDSEDQAAALIPGQKEVDGEQVDFEEGEKITVTDGENEYKFVWQGGKAITAPEEPINESYGNELKKVADAFTTMSNAMHGDAGDDLALWLDLGVRLNIITDDDIDRIASDIEDNR